MFVLKYFFKVEFDIGYQILKLVLNLKMTQISDIRYLISCIIQNSYQIRRYQIFTCIYTLEFLPDKQISDIYSTRCMALVSMKLYDISETE
jgi:hypothetical protein